MIKGKFWFWDKLNRKYKFGTISTGRVFFGNELQHIYETYCKHKEQIESRNFFYTYTIADN